MESVVNLGEFSVSSLFDRGIGTVANKEVYTT